jgi:hypothetical protein
MPTILRWGPYRAFFYSNERGEPPHIHVQSGSSEAKFWLHDLTVAANAGFPAHEIGARAFSVPIESERGSRFSI